VSKLRSASVWRAPALCDIAQITSINVPITLFPPRDIKRGRNIGSRSDQKLSGAKERTIARQRHHLVRHGRLSPTGLRWRILRRRIDLYERFPSIKRPKSTTSPCSPFPSLSLSLSSCSDLPSYLTLPTIEPEDVHSLTRPRDH